jgi:hypothetical protein
MKPIGPQEINKAFEDLRNKNKSIEEAYCRLNKRLTFLRRFIGEEKYQEFVKQYKEDDNNE